MERTFSVLVNDRPGVLARVAGLFSRRDFNIASITVGTAEEAGLSRMTIVSSGDDAMALQIMRQLEKLVEVIEVADISKDPVVKRELALIKVEADKNSRPEISHILEPFRVAIVDVGHSSLTVQVTGGVEKIDALIGLLRPYGILEIARTGVTALLRAAAKEVEESGEEVGS
ncbi:acetolactate synthase small subunit [Sulfoacidibacillus thermotolerans]|uniref:Acetolactate synthase small subunit n=1 Tax=Sulfoacidibacillus thermotolerans TaxID=1765684 RepID=A0A2U3DAP1_SULT2|nr:acetolactate synthase small subunit [Sulfoacidibacillus thermotolerans]PWI58323.1 acetolactate synthase small subunit [Sulfoacidibacillus thermotolerans]